MRKPKEIVKKYKSFIVAATEEEAIRVIRQIQIEAIEETVKMCAENAYITDGDSVLEHFYSDYGARIYVNTKSILQVAEQLKKELE